MVARQRLGFAGSIEPFSCQNRITTSLETSVVTPGLQDHHNEVRLGQALPSISDDLFPHSGRPYFYKAGRPIRLSQQSP
jgi:hypothetical protein